MLTIVLWGCPQCWFDKGCATVVLDRCEYDKKLQTMLDDSQTYEKIDKDPAPSLE